jgi:hypothetical protein
MARLRQANGFPPVGRLGAHLEPGTFEDRAKPLTHNLMIVG